MRSFSGDLKELKDLLIKLLSTRNHLSYLDLKLVL